MTVDEDSPTSRRVREKVTSLGVHWQPLSVCAVARQRQNRATMTTDYHPSIRSSQAVLVEEADRSSWFDLLSAVHTFSANSRSMTSLSLCRYDHLHVPGAVPYFKRPPATVLTTGRWRAASSWVREL